MESGEIRDSEPFVILAGASHGGGSGARDAPAESGGEVVAKRLCKVCCSGRVFWAHVDGERPDCFEWLCTQLDLDPAETTMSVASSDASAPDMPTADARVSSSAELREALAGFMSDDPEEPMRVEVQLNRVNRVTLLAQSFIVVEPPIDEREELAGGSLTSE